MQRLRLLAVCLLVAITGCETLNVGDRGPSSPPPITGFEVSVPDNVRPCEVVDFSLSIQSSRTTTATILWEFGGDLTATTQLGPFTVVVDGTYVEEQSVEIKTIPELLGVFTDIVSVTVTDESGLSATKVYNFNRRHTSNQLPTITGVFNAADCSVTVTTADSDNADVRVTVSGLTDAVPDAMEKTVIGGNGTVTFYFRPTSIIAGANSDVTFTQETLPGPCGGGGDVSMVPAVVHITCPGFVPLADTLYAIPLSTTTTVGTPVTILVFSGDPTNPFQYMTGVRVTAGGGFDYDGGSFNVGDVGGAADDVDGIWSSMGINNGDFLLPPDSFFPICDVGNGLNCIDFNVTPLGGSDLAGSEWGALFNFGATFTTPGMYTLGFQQTNVVNRTYYQDGNQAPDYFWGDITNNHAGVPNTITVN